MKANSDKIEAETFPCARCGKPVPAEKAKKGPTFIFCSAPCSRKNIASERDMRVYHYLVRSHFNQSGPRRIKKRMLIQSPEYSLSLDAARAHGIEAMFQFGVTVDEMFSHDAPESFRSGVISIQQMFQELTK